MILVIYNYTPELELSMLIYDYKSTRVSRGRIQGRGGGRPPKIGKNMISWRKIVIFHTKNPKSFRTSLRSAQFF